MKKLLMVALTLWMLVGCACATDIIESQWEALDTEGLEESAQEYMGDIVLDPTIDLDEGLMSILDTGSGQVVGILRKGLRSGVLLLVVVMLCGLVEGTTALGGQMVDVSSLVGALAITAVSVTDVNTLIGLGTGAIANMETFSKVLIPTVTAAAAASGTPGGAVARQFATMLFSDVLMTVINRLLLPMLYAYIALSVGYAAMGNEGLKRISGTVKWLVTTILTGILLVFVTYLSVSGIIAGATDAAAIKAAKFAVSSVIPVVGSILSDASETLLAGAGLLKNAVGVFGMLVVIAICLIPFLSLGIHYLTYKVTAALTATISSGRIGGLIEAISTAFGLVLGMTGACAVLLLVSLVSAVSAVTV